MKYFALFAIAAAIQCYSAQQLRQSLCWALCRHEGFDTGTYEPKKDKCVCGVLKDFKEMTNPVLKVPADPGG